MSEAPKQIWAVHWNAEGAVTNGAWADTIRHFGGGVEYIRADHVDALLKAEREKHADIAKAGAAGPDTLNLWSKVDGS